MRGAGEPLPCRSGLLGEKPLTAPSSVDSGEGRFPSQRHSLAVCGEAPIFGGILAKLSPTVALYCIFSGSDNPGARPFELHMKYAFIHTYKPVLDDEPY